MTITVSTDGSALGNPNGPMGWAWADHTSSDIRGHDHTGDCDAGGATNGTNQIGELCAVLQALRAHPGDEPLLIETDSQYAINCSTKWVHGWKKNGWKNSKKEPVKNAAVIKAIDEEIRKREGSVDFRWVKGHAGNAGNEKVDELARTYAEDCRSHAREGYLPLEGWQALLASPYAQGTDIPEDAQQLLDGNISEEEYCTKRAMGGSQQTTSTLSTPEPQDTSPYKEVEQNDIHTSATPQDSDKRSIPTTPETSQQSHTNSQTLLRHSGLHVTGEVQFTPPPESSPNFNGQPRTVRGYIEIEGVVHGDGSMTIENAPFLIYQQ